MVGCVAAMMLAGPDWAAITVNSATVDGATGDRPEGPVESLQLTCNAAADPRRVA